VPAGTATASFGQYTITASALGAGAHQVAATASDAAGNVSAPSTGLTVTILTSAVAPSAPDLDAASDSGWSDSDDLTRVNQPTLTGTASPGATVTLYIGATAIGSGTANAAGAYAVTTSALADGTRSITARATDQAGNASPASAATAITIDTRAPVLTSASSGDGGGTAGRMQAGDTLTLVFDEAMAPTEVPITVTVTESRGNGSGGTLRIPGLIQDAPIDGGYLGGRNSSGTAAGSVAQSSDQKRLTVTLGTVTTTGNGVDNDDADVTLRPDPGLTDLAGNGATGSATVTRLF
jgi:hypothetical protein